MNIQKMVSALIRAGFTQDQIADEIESNQSSVSRIQAGKIKSLDLETGMRLIALHERVCRNGKAA